jgi:hypothetical protein
MYNPRMLVTSEIKKVIFGYDIFISYSRKDSMNYAYAVAQHFIEKNYECYLDQLSSTTPGKQLPSNIKKAIKSSTAFVLIGSENAGLSEAIKSEILFFLDGNKNKPLVPINVNGAINNNAIWFEDINGLALIEETKKNLSNGAPSADVLSRVANSLTFKKKSVRLRRISIFVSLSVLLLSAVVYFQIQENKKEVDRSQKNKILAEINNFHASARDYYLKGDYEKALAALTEISKIDTDKDSVFTFFEEGINECVSKDSFVQGANFVGATYKLFQNDFSKRFADIHCKFLFSEARHMLKNYHPINLYGNDSINNIIACILNRINKYGSYSDSITSFFKREYYPPLSVNTYFTQDSYGNGFEMPLNFSGEEEMVTWVGKDSLHVNNITGTHKYAIPKEKIEDIHMWHIRSFFNRQNNNELLIYYSRQFPQPENDTIQSMAIIYNEGKELRRITNPLQIGISNMAEIRSYSDGQPDGTYYFSNDSLLVKKKIFTAEKSMDYSFIDSVYANGRLVKSKQGKRNLFMKNDSMFILNNAGGVLEVIDKNHTKHEGDGITYSLNSPFIFVQHSLEYPEKAFYFFDTGFHYKAMLLFCERPLTLQNGKYLLDEESQQLWYGNPSEFFSAKNWNESLTKEQKIKWGLEFE